VIICKEKAMKRILSIVIIVSIVLLLCACQPTPEQEFIVSKSDHLAEQKIEGAALTEDTVTTESDGQLPASDAPTETTAAPNRVQTFPTRWDEEDIPIREYVTLRIHADVETKQDGIYPVFKTRTHTLTSEDVIAIASKLLDTPKEMQYLNARTKEEWGRELKEYLDAVAAWEAWVQAGKPNDGVDRDEAGFDPVEVEETTKWYAEQIQNAPDRIETQKVSDYSGYHINESVSYMLRDGGFACISAQNDRTWRNYMHISNLCKSQGYLYYAYQYEDDKKPGADASMKRSAALWQEPTLTRADAEAIAYRELEKLGFSDFRIAYGEKAMLFDVGETVATVRVASGWGFRLNRDYGEYPLIDVKYEPCELLNYGDDDAYAVNEPIGEEQITVFVDENGIQSFTYLCPKEIVGKANANVELLPFEEIQRIVKNTLSVCYPVERYQGSADRQWELEVYRMVLTTYTLRVRDSDAFYETPCWVVLFDGWFGQERDMQNMRMQSIVINAIDGTVVHDKQGY